jgi:hypothetical protein
MKVTVLAGENGAVLQPNPNKPEYGSIALEQLVFTTKNGFMNKRRRVAFIAGKVEELSEFLEVSGVKAGSSLPGKLIVHESFHPFFEDQTPKVNPQTGAVMLCDGAPIYQKTFYDESGTMLDNYVQGDIAAGPQIMDPQTKEGIPSALQSLRLSNVS